MKLSTLFVVVNVNVLRRRKMISKKNWLCEAAGYKSYSYSRGGSVCDGDVKVKEKLNIPTEKEIYQNVARWKTRIDFKKLNEKEKLIHALHVDALDNKEDVYTDPDTGYSVLTMATHLRKGKCCSNGCRHCPYQHENVPNEKKGSSGSYNTAFYSK